ncbi:MAG TPA: hypothetical protein VL523_03405 [Terriglobia bacterium]|nr:hypothetical protein [Terriglobia bacterium]
MKLKPEDEVDNEDVKGVIRLVEKEERDALESCETALDALTETGSAARSKLAPRPEDHWMMAQGDQLRRAIDRKQWVINGLVQTFGLTAKLRAGSAESGPEEPPHPI